MTASKSHSPMSSCISKNRLPIALLADSNPCTRPRPFRLIEMLKDHYELFVFGHPSFAIQGVHNCPFPALKSRKDRSIKEQEDLDLALKYKDWNSLIFTPNRLILQDLLFQTPNLRLLIVEDLPLLPIALAYKARFPESKILIDLREFYPLEYENDPQWMQGFGQFFDYLCRSHLPHVDLALSVSEGIAKRYKQDYGISCELFLSLPPFYDLNPSSPSTSRIRLVYHGLISQDRESENLLEIASQLAPHLQLNLMILSNHPSFLHSFLQKAKGIPNLQIIPPVSLESIIPFTQAFDLGLLTLKPNGFNNTYALPNKFFEYIQARLGIIATPLPSIAPLISDYGLGRCSPDFETSSLIALLNSLTLEEVGSFKMKAHQASQTFNTSANKGKILDLIHRLLEPQNTQ